MAQDVLKVYEITIKTTLSAYSVTDASRRAEEDFNIDEDDIMKIEYVEDEEDDED